MNFHPEKRKTGNSAKFRPDSQKRTSDSDSATKNMWESVKIRIEGIFDLKFVLILGVEKTTMTCIKRSCKNNFLTYGSDDKQEGGLVFLICFSWLLPCYLLP